MATNNLLHQLNNTTPEGGDGIVVRKQIPLAALNLQSSVAIAADETNAIAVKCEQTVDTLFIQDIVIPSDYDETSDHLKLRVLASQLLVSTDDDVELDAKAYVKSAGVALGSDLDPTAPGTVLSTTEQWVEFDLSGNSLVYGNVLHWHLITNGANDTNGEEVLIHAVEIEYKSMIVAFDEDDRS